MKKLFVSLAALGLLGGFATVAHADDIVVPSDAGTLTVSTDGHWAEADGAESNPDPLDGSIYIGEDAGGICAGDEGNHASRTEDGTETCNEDALPA